MKYDSENMLTVINISSFFESNKYFKYDVISSDLIKDISLNLKYKDVLPPWDL